MLRAFVTGAVRQYGNDRPLATPNAVIFDPSPAFFPSMMNTASLMKKENRNYSDEDQLTEYASNRVSADFLRFLVDNRLLKHLSQGIIGIRAVVSCLLAARVTIQPLRLYNEDFVGHNPIGYDILWLALLASALVFTATKQYLGLLQNPIISSGYSTPHYSRV